MKNKYIIVVAMLLALVIGAGFVLATNHGDQRILDQSDARGAGHGDIAQQNDDHDDHAGDEHEDNHDLHVDDHGGEEHEDEAGMVELTRAQQQEIGLEIATARSGDLEQILSLVGEVRLHEDRLAHLVPRVPGIVRTVSVSLGETVQEGQVLAIIDSPELAELKADYLEKSRNLELTRRTFARKQYLKQENIASEADWLEAQAAFQNAETMVHSAKRRLSLLGMTAAEMHDLAAAPDEAFGRYALKSPIAGTIISRHITRGEKIGEQEVFVVADLDVVWVDLRIPAQDLVRVYPGLAVEITSTDGGKTDGTLTMVGPVVDPESRTALGRIVLPNPEGLWKPGVFVTGHIQGKTSSAVVVVPAEAVQNIDGENIIFLPDGQGFKPVDVIVGRSIKGKTEILAGLHAGDRYVTRGAFALKAVVVTSGAGAHAGHGH